MYYRQLPAFRRRQYEIYRVRPELVGQSGNGPSLPEVISDADLRRRFPPPVLERVEQWLRTGLIDDLYAYGNHPELRLCMALLLCRLLFRSGIWRDAVRCAYYGRLFSVDFSLDRLLAMPQGAQL